MTKPKSKVTFIGYVKKHRDLKDVAAWSDMDYTTHLWLTGFIYRSKGSVVEHEKPDAWPPRKLRITIEEIK